MPNNQMAERMDELIRAVDEIFVGKIPSEDDLYGIHQVLVERRNDEIVRKSVPDVEIEETIEFYERHLWSRDDDLINDDVSRRFDIVLTALHQYRKPTDKAVQNMVQTFESFLSSGHDADWTGDTVSNQYLHDAILVALRQTRTEPCWYCKDIESHGIKSVKTVTDESDRELGAYDTPYNYCPNCGRKLVKQDGRS